MPITFTEADVDDVLGNKSSRINFTEADVNSVLDEKPSRVYFSEADVSSVLDEQRSLRRTALQTEKTSLQAENRRTSLALGATEVAEGVTAALEDINPLFLIPIQAHRLGRKLGLIPDGYAEPFSPEFNKYSDGTPILEFPKLEPDQIKPLVPFLMKHVAPLLMPGLTSGILDSKDPKQVDSLAIALSGGTKAASDFADFFLTKDGLTTLASGRVAPKAAQQILAWAFATKMTSDVKPVAKEFGATYDELSASEKIRKGLGLATQIVLPATITAHGQGTKANTVRKAQAPLTARAFEEATVTPAAGRRAPAGAVPPIAKEPNARGVETPFEKTEGEQGNIVLMTPAEWTANPASTFYSGPEQHAGEAQPVVEIGAENFGGIKGKYGGRWGIRLAEGPGQALTYMHEVGHGVFNQLTKLQRQIWMVLTEGEHNAKGTLSMIGGHDANERRLDIPAERFADVYALWFTHEGPISTGFLPSQVQDFMRNRFGKNGPRKINAHKTAIEQSLAKGHSVSAEAVDAYGIKLPEGYVRVRDRYVTPEIAEILARKRATGTEPPVIESTLPLVTEAELAALEGKRAVAPVKDAVGEEVKPTEPAEMTPDEWQAKHQRTRGGSPQFQGNAPMERGRPVPLSEQEARNELNPVERNNLHDDGTVTIYRGVSKDTVDLAPGDFVTLDKEHAQRFADKQGGRVIEHRVPQSDVVWVFDAKGPHPLRYAPKGALSVQMAHRIEINNAMVELKPLSAAAVDYYGIKLSEGYFLEGDRYVFKPAGDAKPAPPVLEAKPVAEMTQDEYAANIATGKTGVRGQEMFHGTTQPAGSEMMPNALGLVFVSPSETEARVFSGAGAKGGRVIKVNVDTSNVFDPRKPEHLEKLGATDEDKLWNSAYVENEDWVAKIKAAGFSGFWVKDVAGKYHGEWNVALFDRPKTDAANAGGKTAPPPIDLADTFRDEGVSRTEPVQDYQEPTPTETAVKADEFVEKPAELVAESKPAAEMTPEEYLKEFRLDPKENKGGYESQHNQEVLTAVKNHLPVSSEAMDYFWGEAEKPKGYVLEGDRYVFKPAVDVKPAPPVDAKNATTEPAGEVKPVPVQDYQEPTPTETAVKADEFVEKPAEPVTETIQQRASRIASWLGGKVVGSSAREGNARDVDILMREEQIPDAIKKLEADGYEQQGSQVVSPKEARQSGKNFGDGWARNWYLKNKAGDVIELWHQDKGILVPQLTDKPAVEAKPAPPVLEAKPAAPTTYADKVDQWTAKLESMIDRSPKPLQAAWLPGLDSASVQAIKNTALEVAIKVLQATKNLPAAILVAIENIKAQLAERKYKGAFHEDIFTAEVHKFLEGPTLGRRVSKALQWRGDTEELQYVGTSNPARTVEAKAFIREQKGDLQRVIEQLENVREDGQHSTLTDGERMVTAEIVERAANENWKATTDPMEREALHILGRRAQRLQKVLASKAGGNLQAAGQLKQDAASRGLGAMDEQRAAAVDNKLGKDLPSDLSQKIVKWANKQKGVVEKLLRHVLNGGENADFLNEMFTRIKGELVQERALDFQERINALILPLMNWREFLERKGAANLTKTFTGLIDVAQPEGPLWTADKALERQLGGILREKMQEAGIIKKDGTKNSNERSIAEVLGKKELREGKLRKLEKSVREEINLREAAEKKRAGDDLAALDAIEAKYEHLRDAWDEALGAMQTDPASKSFLRGMVHDELKRLGTKWNDVLDKGQGAIDALRDSVVNKLTGDVKKVSKGLDPDALGLDTDLLGQHLGAAFDRIADYKRNRYEMNLLYKRAMEAGQKTIRDDSNTEANALIRKHARYEKQRDESGGMPDSALKQDFLQQIKTPSSRDAFMARMKRHGLTDASADKLFRVAASERNVRELQANAKEQKGFAKERNRLLQDNLYLKSVVKLVGEGTGIDWSDIMQTGELRQAAHRNEVFQRILNHPLLQHLTDRQARGLAVSLDKAYEAIQKDQMLREFNKTLELPGIKPGIKAKISEALPELVRWANQGLLDIDQFREAVALKMGLPEFSKDTADVIRKQGARIEKLSTLTEEQKRANPDTWKEMESDQARANSREILKANTEIEIAIAKDAPDWFKDPNVVREVAVANTLLKISSETKQSIDASFQGITDILFRALVNLGRNRETDATMGRKTNRLRDIADEFAAIRTLLQAAPAAFRYGWEGFAHGTVSQTKTVFGIKHGRHALDRLSRFSEEQEKLGQRLFKEGKESESAVAYAKSVASGFLAQMKWSTRFFRGWDEFTTTFTKQHALRSIIREELIGKGLSREEVRKQTDAAMGNLLSDRFAAGVVQAQNAEIFGIKVSKGEAAARAWDLAHVWQLQRLRRIGFSPEKIEAEIRHEANVGAWNTSELGFGWGGIVADFYGKKVDWAASLYPPVTTPLTVLGLFRNAMGISINKGLTWIGFGLNPNAFKNAAGEYAPGYSTERLRAQRKLEAFVGLSMIGTATGLWASGVLRVRNQLSPDEAEREKQYAQGHRAGTVEIRWTDKHGNELFIPLSMTTGPLSYIRYGLAGIGAIQDYNELNNKRDAVIKNKAEELGLEPVYNDKATMANLVGVATGAAMTVMTGNRVGGGLSGPITDYSGQFTPKKAAASLLTTVTPFNPFIKDIEKSQGIENDPKQTSIFGMWLPNAVTGANEKTPALNRLGLPITENTFKRYIALQTGGTVPAPIGPDDVRNNRVMRMALKANWWPSEFSANVIKDKTYGSLSQKDRAQFEDLKAKFLNRSIGKLTLEDEMLPREKLALLLEILEKNAQTEALDQIDARTYRSRR